jgi:tetratricopeptide (TPR) repeat protein
VVETPATTGLPCYNLRVPAAPLKQSYSREEVRRLLGVSERQLRSWEDRGLVSRAEAFGFSDLIALQTLVKLKADGIPAARIHSAVTALRRTLRGVDNPLKELRVVADGKKIRVLIDGQKMEPASGQLLLDFDENALSKLLDFPKADRRERLRAGHWFQRGLEMETAGAPIDQVMDAYEKAIALDDHCVGAMVNLGTIHFHTRDWAAAERYYRQALESDPNYALAHFNLGNLFDEKNDLANAQFHYQSALAISPNYADAHYNLALLAQRTGQLMNAVRHWRIYLKLDPGSNWAAIARRELDKLREATVVTGARK